MRKPILVNYRVKRSSEKGVRLDEKALREEIKLLANTANKRLARLENNNLTDSPAFQTATKDGKLRFGVRGKNFNQLQQEYSRLVNFIQAETSTIRGINRNLKSIAKTTGLKYRTIGELRQKTANFFQLSSMVEQYLRNVEDMASAIGYQKIWEAVNQYTQEQGINLADTSASIEDMERMVSDIVNATKGIKPDTEQLEASTVFFTKR